MKIFTRLTAITISLAMILASMFTVAYADTITFTDVSEDYQYSDAIYSLVSKGIINGYTESDGTSTFKPDNTITRAEFAKLLVLSTTPGVVHTATTDKFPDLSVDHWANTYIAAAVNTGAINGYEDGTFKPENPVSYGEAVKMIVCTLGYGSVVTPTEPWYDGYIRIANQIKLTKSAVGLGSNEAKRGLVAQLIYNIDDVDKLLQTGTDKYGNPQFGSDMSKEDYEEYDGVVTAVFEDTLEGISYGLKRGQIMIDDEVFNIGEYSIDKLYSYLGKSVIVEHEDDSKKTIVEIKEDRNKTLTIEDIDIDEINGREITYFDDRDREEELELASDLYVVYNGRGVERELIDDDFIEEYLNIDCGEITFLNNDGRADYDVAFVTNYETMYVSNRTSSDGVFKIYDTYGPVSDITLKDNDCTVYKVTSEGGNKTKVDSLSSIAANNVISIASPLDDTEGTEVIISNVTLKGKRIESVSKGIYTIDGDEYELSAYYEDLIEEDSSYELEKGDVGTFYLDFTGRIAYYTKSDTTDPYGYLATIEESSGLKNSITAYIFTQSGSWLEEYPFADNIRVNGKRYTPDEAVEILKDTAELINADKPAAMAENADYGQLIKYKLNSSAEISEIYTIDPDGDFDNGTIIPGSFISDADEEDEKTPFSKGVKLNYASNSKVFKDTNGSNQFTINSSTIVIYVPYDRESNLKDYKKRTYSTFTDGGSYMVEPYDMSSTTAKVVLVYSNGAATDATIYTDAKPIFIEEIRTKKNDDGEYAEYITYYTAGSTKADSIFVSDDISFERLGIEPGDVIRVAQENGEICGVQNVFVGGELYDWDEDDVFTTEVDDDNVISHSYNSDSNYYEVVLGKAYSKTEENDSITVVPLGGSDWMPYSVTSSTKIYKWNADEDVFETDGIMEEIAAIDKTSEEAASNILVIKRGSSLLAIYILD